MRSSGRWSPFEGGDPYELGASSECLERGPLTVRWLLGLGYKEVTGVHPYLTELSPTKSGPRMSMFRVFSS